MIKTNVSGANNVLEAARWARVERCLLISSDKAFEPVSPYGQTKALAEALFHAANGYGGMRTAVCRYGNVAGSTGSVIPIWRRMNGTAVMTDPECTRFWMTKFQAVEFVMETLKNMVGGELQIPALPGFRLGDLATAMGISPRIIGLNTFEKRHEGMAPGNTSDVARRMTVDELRGALATT
jgi:UDP-N-acetylglucosamine 4,6-dehydratase